MIAHVKEEVVDHGVMIFGSQREKGGVRTETRLGSGVVKSLKEKTYFLVELKSSLIVCSSSP